MHFSLKMVQNAVLPHGRVIFIAREKEMRYRKWKWGTQAIWLVPACVCFIGTQFEELATLDWLRQLLWQSFGSCTWVACPWLPSQTKRGHLLYYKNKVFIQNSLQRDRRNLFASNYCLTIPWYARVFYHRNSGEGIQCDDSQLYFISPRFWHLISNICIFFLFRLKGAGW